VRGYILILLVICTIAFSGWIAISDGLIDRSGKGTDLFMNRRDSMPQNGDPRRPQGAVPWPARSRHSYDLVVLAVAIAFPARHRLDAGFAIMRSACSPRPGRCRLSRAIAGAAGLRLIVPLALYGFTLRVRRSITQLQIRCNG